MLNFVINGLYRFLLLVMKILRPRIISLVIDLLDVSNLLLYEQSLLLVKVFQPLIKHNALVIQSVDPYLKL